MRQISRMMTRSAHAKSKAPENARFCLEDSCEKVDDQRPAWLTEEEDKELESMFFEILPDEDGFVDWNTPRPATQGGEETLDIPSSISAGKESENPQSSGEIDHQLEAKSVVDKAVQTDNFKILLSIDLQQLLSHSLASGVVSIRQVSLLPGSTSPSIPQTSPGESVSDTLGSSVEQGIQSFVSVKEVPTCQERGPRTSAPSQSSASVGCVCTQAQSEEISSAVEVEKLKEVTNSQIDGLSKELELQRKTISTNTFYGQSKIKINTKQVVNREIVENCLREEVMSSVNNCEEMSLISENLKCQRKRNNHKHNVEDEPNSKIFAIEKSKIKITKPKNKNIIPRIQNFSQNQRKKLSKVILDSYDKTNVQSTEKTSRKVTAVSKSASLQSPMLTLSVDVTTCKTNCCSFKKLPLKCVLCNKLYLNLQQLMNHNKSKHDVNICNTQLNIASLSSNVANTACLVVDENLTCKLCNLRFMYSNFIRHQITVHSAQVTFVPPNVLINNKEINYFCQVCRDDCENIFYYIDHLKIIHEIDTTCSYTHNVITFCKKNVTQ